MGKEKKDDEIEIPLDDDEELTPQEPISKELKNKIKCSGFYEGFTSYKYISLGINPEQLISTQKELDAQFKEIKSKILEGEITVLPQQRSISDIIIRNKSTNLDIEKLVKNQQIEEDSKQIKYLEVKLLQLKETNAILEKMKKNQGDKLTEIERRTLNDKIKSLLNEIKVIEGKIEGLKLISSKNDAKRITKKEYLQNFDKDLEKVKEKSENWRKLHRESIEKLELIKKLNEEAMIKYDENQQQIKNEKDEKWRAIKDEKHEKYKEKIEKIHEEVMNFNFPEFDKDVNDYLYVKKDQEFKEKLEEEKQEEERQREEKLEDMKKLNPPGKLQLEEFHEVVVQKSAEVKERNFLKREEHLKKLFGDQYNPKVHNFGGDENNVQEIGDSDFNIDLSEQYKSNYAKVEEELLKKKQEELNKIKEIREKKLKFIKEIKLPEASHSKKKEMQILIKENRGMHLINDLKNDDNNKLKNFLKHYEELKKDLIEKTLNKKKEIKAIMDSKSKIQLNTHMTQPYPTKASKNFFNNNSNFYNNFYSSNELVTNEVSVNKNYTRLTTENKVNSQSLQDLRLLLPKKTDIRKPLDKYPNYLLEVKSLRDKSTEANPLNNKNLVANYMSLSNDMKTLEKEAKQKIQLYKISSGVKGKGINPVVSAQAQADASENLIDLIKLKLKLLNAKSK